MSNLSKLIDKAYAAASALPVAAPAPDAFLIDKKKRKTEHEGSDDEGSDESSEGKQSKWGSGTIAKIDYSLHYRPYFDLLEATRRDVNKLLLLRDRIVTENDEAATGEPNAEQATLEELSRLLRDNEREIDATVAQLTEARGHAKQFRKQVDKAVEKIANANVVVMWRLDLLAGNGELDKVLGLFFSKEAPEKFVEEIGDSFPMNAYPVVTSVYIPRATDGSGKPLLPADERYDVVMSRPGEPLPLGHIYDQAAKISFAVIYPDATFVKA